MSYNERRNYADHLDKTLKLICYQLLFTFAFTIIVTLCDPVKLLFRVFILPILSFGITGSIVTLIYMNYVDEMTKNQLALFTFFEAVVITTFCQLFEYETIIVAMLITLGLSGCLGLYGFMTKHNYSSYGRMLFCCLLSLLVISIGNLFLRNSCLGIIELFLGTILFMSYIVYDVNHYLHLHMNVRLNQMPGDIHIRAATEIYLDIINLFIRIVKMIDMIKKVNQISRSDD